MNHGYLVYSAYIRPSNLGRRKLAAHMPRAVGHGWRVVYMQNTPRNHDLYITRTPRSSMYNHIHIMYTHFDTYMYIIYTYLPT